MMRRVCLILIALMASGFLGGAWGQARNNDFTKRAESIEGKRFKVETNQPRLNERLQSKKYRTPEVSYDMARLNEKKTPRGFEETYPTSRFKTNEYKGPGKIRMQSYRDDGKMVPRLGEDAEMLWENARAIRFQKRYDKMLDEQLSEIEAAKEEGLSLRDINRYQFQRRHSDSSSIPVQRAGGE